MELKKKIFWREVETVDPEELGLPLRSVKQVLHFDKDIENQEIYLLWIRPICQATQNQGGVTQKETDEMHFW